MYVFSSRPSIFKSPKRTGSARTESSEWFMFVGDCDAGAASPAKAALRAEAGLDPDPGRGAAKEDRGERGRGAPGPGRPDAL